MENLCRSEGIVLQTMDFQDYDQILTVYSLEEGLIKLIQKQARRQNHKKGSATALTHAEFVYAKGSSELFRCQEISLLNAYLSLRASLHVMRASCEIVDAVKQSQMLHQPSPILYQLLLLYLEKLPSMKNPYALSASFLLKVLRHEGICDLETLLEKVDETEFPSIHTLAFSKTFVALDQCPFSDPLHQQITQFFLEQIQ